MFYKNKILKDGLILFCIARGTRYFIFITGHSCHSTKNILRIFKAMPSHRQDCWALLEVQCGASSVATVHWMCVAPGCGLCSTGHLCLVSDGVAREGLVSQSVARQR